MMRHRESVLRESLQNSAEKSRIARDQRHAFVERLIFLSHHQNEETIYHGPFLNFDETIVRICERYKVSAENIHAAPLLYAKYFFDVHDMKFAKALPAYLHLNLAARSNAATAPPPVRGVQPPVAKPIPAGATADPEKTPDLPPGISGKDAVESADSDAVSARPAPLPGQKPPSREPEPARPVKHAETNPRAIRSPASVLTLGLIEEAARAELAATGWRPASSMRKIKYGDLAKSGRTWVSVNSAFASQHSGLKGCGFKSLLAFFDARGIPRRIDLPPGVAPVYDSPAIPAKVILKDAITAVVDLAAIPTADAYGDMILSNGRTVRELNEAFRKSAIEGWQDYMEQPAPRNLSDFMVATGVAIRRGKKLVPAPPSRLQTIAARLG